MRSFYISPRAATITAEGVIRGYVAVWGDLEHKDAYDTWWDKERPADIGIDYVPFPIKYEHGIDGAIKRETVGSVDRIWIDDTGYAFEGHLDRSSPFFPLIVSELTERQLKTSSATGQHMADFHDDGAFKSWPLVELSLTKTPAEERMPAVQLVRSATGGVLLTPSSQPLNNQSNNSQGEPSMDPSQLIEQLKTSGADANAIINALVAAGFSLDELMGALQQGQPPAEMSAPTPTPEAGRSADFSGLIAALQQRKQQADLEAMRAKQAELEQALTAMRNAPPAPQPRQSGGGSAADISVTEPRKYWGRSLADLMFVHQVLRSRGQQMTDDFYRTLAGRTAQALEKREEIVFNPAVRSLLKGTRSDEIVTSTNTGNGDEWIGVAYSGTLWEKARNNRIFQALVSKGMWVEEVPDGDESVIIFTEGSDPTVYTITQSADLDATGRPTVVVPVTAPGTGQTPLTPGYLGMAIAYTSVFEEDSMIKGATQFNKQMQEKAEETIEQLFFNGDTATSGNVNNDGTTDSTTSYYKASNGARKYALVTGSGTKLDIGTLDDSKLRLILKLFPSAIRTRKNQIAFVMDPDTHNTSLGMLATKTESERARLATINSGVLENIWGVDNLESGFIPSADSDGKVTNGGNVAETGTVMGIYAPYWAMGWKRKVTIETDKDILAQSNLIVATFRLGFVPRGAGAAVAGYNVTIA